MTKSIKILLAVGAVALTVLIVSVSLLLFLNSQKSPTWQEQYDLGIRYLSEGNYQEAIVAFTAAIEIDAMRPEAYLKAAEAYEAAGDSEAAKAILEKGYDATGDESLTSKEETSENESLIPQQETALWRSDNLITREEVTFAGVPFYELDVETAAAYLPEGNYSDMGSSIYWMGNPSLRQSVDSDVLDEIYYHSDSNLALQPEFRNIYMGMPMTEALENLGFTPFLIQKVQSVLDEEAISSESFVIFDDYESYNSYPRVSFELDNWANEMNGIDAQFIRGTISWWDREPDHMVVASFGFNDGLLESIQLLNYFYNNFH